jgi:hypothetical protein
MIPHPRAGTRTWVGHEAREWPPRTLSWGVRSLVSEVVQDVHRRQQKIAQRRGGPSIDV